MNKFLKDAKSFAPKLLNNIEIVLISLMIFASPFVVNYNDLPKGYELPKVIFFQIFTLILICIYSVRVFFNLSKVNSIKFDKSLIVLVFSIAIILVASIASPFSNGVNGQSLTTDIPWIGNSFRLQGAYTHILMAIFAYIVFKRVTRKNIVLVFLAFFFSSFIQSLISFGQLSYFLKVDPTVIFEGYYINGTFGQANFYSGRIMLGIFSGIFLLSISLSIVRRKSLYKYFYIFFFYLFVPLATLISIAGLIISFSTWGIISTIVLVFVLIIYETTNLSQSKKSRIHFGHIFGSFIIIACGIGAYLLFKQYTDQVENFRLSIWQKILEISKKGNFLNTFLGYGFDTLGEVFKSFGEFKGLYVDRAHNFFLDLHTQGGLISLVGFLGLITFSYLKFIFNNSSKTLSYLFIGMILWLFRSFVHESGIVNLYDFLVLMGATFALQKDLRINLSKK